MADIKINAKQWESVSPKDQKKITNILREASLLDKGDSIVADPETEAAELEDETDLSICTTLCNTAQAAAELACKRIPWPGDKICIYAAQKAGDFCRSKC